MGLFSKKEKPVNGMMGVDIGAGGIKMTELRKDGGRMRLLTYAYSVFPNGGGETTILDDPKRAGGIIKDMMKQAGMKSTRTNASLPSHSVFHTIITIPIPKSAKTNLKPIIEAQVQKYLPLPLDEMILDSEIIDKEKLPKPVLIEKKKDKKKVEQKKLVEKKAPPKESDVGHVRVLVSGAPRVLVAKYVEVFKQTKLQLISLETEVFALIRSLIGKDRSRVMIVDIGFERTNITIVDRGIPYLHRSIKAGGDHVTQMLAKQMGLSHAEAEQSKLDLALTPTREGNIPPVLQEALSPIMHEVKYSLELYAQQSFHDNNTVEKIILTGGSAQLPYIDSLLAKALDMNVYVGDPWARIATPKGLRPVLDEIGPRFSVSVGLGMKDLEEKKKK
jgi:type IV pilus assembly protein PilM